MKSRKMKMKSILKAAICCDIEEVVVTSPIGNLILKHCQYGLHSISQTAPPTNLDKPPKNERFVVKVIEPTTTTKELDDGIKQTIEWFQTYFNDPRGTRDSSIPQICQHSIGKDTFRGKVRLALMKNVKAGETITYQALAALVQNKGASRAVGSAMSNNPLSILVPCHRVIKSDGKPGNYGKSTRNQVKCWLLDFEGASL